MSNQFAIFLSPEDFQEFIQLTKIPQNNKQHGQFLEYYQLLGQRYIDVLVLDTLFNRIKEMKQLNQTNRQIILHVSRQFSNTLYHNLSGAVLISIGIAFNQNDKAQIKSVKKHVKNIIKKLFQKGAFSYHQKSFSKKTKPSDKYYQWGSFSQGFDDIIYEDKSKIQKPMPNVLKYLNSDQYPSYQNQQESQFYYEHTQQYSQQLYQQQYDQSTEVHEWEEQNEMLNKIAQQYKQPNHGVQGIINNDQKLFNKKSQIKNKLSDGQYYLKFKIKDISTEFNLFMNFLNKAMIIEKKDFQKDGKFYHEVLVDITHSRTNEKTVKFKQLRQGDSKKKARDHAYQKLLLIVFNKLPILFEDYKKYKQVKNIVINDK